MPDVLPDGPEACTEGVVPILQKRGIFRRSYDGTTLRQYLGLAALALEADAHPAQ